MQNKRNRWYLWSTMTLTCLMTLACGLFSNIGLPPSTEVTPTPTKTLDGSGFEKTAIPHPCENLSGSLELQLLVGPSEAVGLTPFSLANIPFIVTANEGIYTIEGGGPVEYYEDAYEAEWGSFTVIFEGDTIVSGECVSSGENGTLNINLLMDGSQTIEVVVEGLTTTYPWEGTPQLNASLPIQEGAQQDGEGWLLILHLN